jgi:hypothetical protein
MSGKAVEDVPTAVQEFIMASVFGWTIKEIRSLSDKDFKTFSPMALNKFVVDCFKPGLG